jgi:secretion/DNA translocation related TadE-like protein
MDEATATTTGSAGVRATHAPADAGVSTVFACLAVGLFMAVTVIGIRLGGAMLARQQAETAADLGALAGAADILRGPGAACATAGEVVAANHGSMTSCAADGLDLLVTVEVSAPAWGSNASARARAGPVTTP